MILAEGFRTGGGMGANLPVDQPGLWIVYAFAALCILALAAAIVVPILAFRHALRRRCQKCGGRTRVVQRMDYVTVDVTEYLKQCEACGSQSVYRRAG